jgi:hypothetical protein
MDLAGHDPVGLAVEEEILLPQPEISALAGESGTKRQDEETEECIPGDSHKVLPFRRFPEIRKILSHLRHSLAARFDLHSPAGLTLAIDQVCM